MKLFISIVSICFMHICSGCGSIGDDSDTERTDTAVMYTEEQDAASDAESLSNNTKIAPLPISVPKVDVRESDPALSADVAPTDYVSKSAAPTVVEAGMKVSDAMCVDGVKQSVSAILTGGKITGTVVLQWKGKSYYTNVDFAEEGCYAFGTRCHTPEQIAAFIELACSEQLTADDFAPDAVVTDCIQ